MDVKIAVSFHNVNGKASVAKMDPSWQTLPLTHPPSQECANDAMELILINTCLIGIPFLSY